MREHDQASLEPDAAGPFNSERAGFKPSRHIVSLSALFAALGSLLAATPALAKPGTHPIVVSTWDARASSVVLGYRHGSLEAGGFNQVGYHANFSSTGGLLSSQFGLFYQNYHDKETSTAHGMAASATAVFNVPVARRFENGLPLAAIDLYLGAAPTALISGERNFITVPLVLGFGVPISPAKVISIVPWFELSPGVNLDTVIKPYEFTEEDVLKYYDPATMTIRDFTADDEAEVVSKSVTLETKVAVGARAGIDLSLHASDYFDFNANIALSSVGSAFSGPRVLYFGGGVTWRWDDIVPAVLPADKRLLNESCDDVEARFQTCPNSSKWRRVDADPATYGPLPLQPGSATTLPSEATPPLAPAPPPVAPAPPAAAPEATPAPATPPPAAPPDVNGAFPSQ